MLRPLSAAQPRVVGLVELAAHLVPERHRPERGLLDTPVLIDPDEIDMGRLPTTVAVSALTMAELAAGPHATVTPTNRDVGRTGCSAPKQRSTPRRSTRTRRAYGRVFAAVTAAGRKARGPRAVDLLVAATALALGLPLYTRNGEDFRGMESLLDVVVG